MNQRIQQLATEVGISVEYLTTTKQWTLIEALAQRIVEEAAREVEGMEIVVEDGHEQWNRAVAHAGLHLREHFGVES